MASEPFRQRGAAECILAFALALTFYGVTLAPTVIWGDSAALVLASLHGSLQLSGPVDHPLFILVGRYFSLLPGDVARNVNFEASVFGALAVMLVYRCGRVLGTSRLAAATGAAALCVSHAFWLHSVIAEVYTANAFFLAATMNLLLEWKRRRRWPWLAAAVAAFAIGLTNHLVLAAIVPAAIAFVLAVAGRQLLMRRLLPGLVVLVLLAVTLAIALASPGSVAAMARGFWNGPAGLSGYLGLDFEPGPAAREAGYYLLYLIYQFPSISLLLGVVGVVVLVRDEPAVAILLLGTMAANGFTFIRHTVWPSVGSAKFVFYITDYVVFAIMCAVGANHVMRNFAARFSSRPLAWASSIMVLAAVALVPPAVYAISPRVATAAEVDLVHARTLPYRDSDRFFLNPNKHGEDGARRFGEDVFRLIKPDAVIFADYTPWTVFQYLQVVERLRPDVTLETSRGMNGTVYVRWTFDRARRRPIYVASLSPGYYDLSALGEYDLVPVGPIVEVRPRQIEESAGP
jgi:hypothetical protein